MKNVQINGIEFLSKEEKEELDQLILKYEDKLKWKTKGDFELNFVIKVHNKNPENKDKRKHFGIHCELTGESHTFEAVADDWNFTTAIRKIFTKLQEEIEHAFHVSEQRSSGKKK